MKLSVNFYVLWVWKFVLTLAKFLIVSILKKSKMVFPSSQWAINKTSSHSKSEWGWARNGTITEQYLVAATSIDKISINTVIYKWQQMCCMTCCIDNRSVFKEKKKVWQWNVTKSTRSSSTRLLLFLKRRTAKWKYYLYNIFIITKKWWTVMKQDGPTGTCRPVMPYCS